jgi:hypothetical protein
MSTIVTRSGKGSALTHAEVDANFTNLNTDKVERTGTVAFTGKQTFATPTTSIASLVLPHGTAPTSPVNGDTWSTTAGLFQRVNGTTRQFADLNSTQTLSAKTLTTPTLTTPLCNGVRYAVTSQTGAYTATAAVTIILCNATTAAFAVTLPTAVGNSGLAFTIKKTDSTANAITINTTSSQTIDGALTLLVSTQWAYAQVVSDGANWLRVG